MNNNLYETERDYSKQREFAKTRPEKVGGTAKTNKNIKLMAERERTEEEFMRISFKANRATKQRELRRMKRNKE